MIRTHARAFALLALTTLALAGCGSSGNKVVAKGQLLKGGSPYAPPRENLVHVTLVALDVVDDAGKKQNGEAYAADVDQETGAFTVKGSDGLGVAPGKYRVAVTQKLTREAFNAANAKGGKLPKGADRDADTLMDKFGLGSSPITREVRPGEELVVDLDKPGA